MGVADEDSKHFVVSKHRFFNILIGSRSYQNTYSEKIVEHF